MSPAGRERAWAALRWGGAVAVASAIHVAVGILVLRDVAEPGSDAPGPPAMTIDLLPAEPAPSAAPAAAASSETVSPSGAPDAAIEPDPVPDVPDPDVPAPDPALATAEAPPAETAPPDLPRSPATVADDPVAVPPPPRTLPASPPTVRRPAELRPDSKRPPRPVRAAGRREDKPERRPSAPGSRASQAVASGGGSSGASSAAWRSQLLAYLQGRVRAPAGAGSSVGVNFSVGRGGQITSARLSRSSGDPAVDGAALAAFRGAVPPPPADYAGPLAFNTNIRIR